MRTGVLWGIDMSQWADWAPVGVGVLFALVVLIGAVLVRRSSRSRGRAVVHSRSLGDRHGWAADDDEERDADAHGSTAERRRAPRRQGKPVAVVIAVEGSAGTRQGTVLDRSVGGLRLAVAGPIDVGTVLNLRVAQAAETLPSVRVEVKHCRKVADDWQIGCQFLQTPPASVMWLFG